MARLDLVRRRVALSDDELETLRLADNGETVDGAARQALQDAGVLDDEGRLAPLVADLVRTMTAPMILATVETGGPQGPALAQVAVHEERVWYTDPWPQDAPDGEVVYHQDELPQLLWTLARLVGLRRRQVPAAAREFSVPLRAIDAVVQTMALSEDVWEPARVVATAGLDRFFAEVEEQDRLMVMATLTHLESTARVTMTWGPDTASDVRGLALWDCGTGGYWVRTSPAEPLRAEEVTPGTVATFRPVSGADAWAALAALLPSGAELRDTVARVSA